MNTIPGIDLSGLPQALQSLDVVANLTSMECPIPESARCVILGKDRPRVCDEVSATAPPVGAGDPTALKQLLSDLDGRIGILSGPDCPAAEAIVAELESERTQHVILDVDTGVDAGSFMDAEDADEVAERLRQLGYL